MQRILTRRNPLILAVLFFSFFHLKAQTTYQKAIGGPQMDYLRSFVQSPDGGYLLVGHSESFGGSDRDIYLVKVDDFGNVQWSKTIGGSATDFPQEIIPINNGYVMTGATQSFSSGGLDFFNARLSLTGDVVWFSTLTGISGESGRGLSMDADSVIYYVGYGISHVLSGSFLNDLYWGKMDINGTFLDHQVVGLGGNEFPYAVRPLPDKSCYIVAYTRDYPGQGYRGLLIHADSAGTVVWANEYGIGNENILFEDIEVDVDGNVLAVGYTQNLLGDLNLCLFKIAPSGNLIWSQQYGAGTEDNGTDIQIDPNGGYFISGYTNMLGSGRDIFIMHTDTAGSVDWQRNYGEFGAELGNYCGNNFYRTADGGYLFAGITNSFGSGNYDYLLIKTDSLGMIDNCVVDTTRFPRANLSTTVVPWVYLERDTIYPDVITTSAVSEISPITTPNCIILDGGDLLLEGEVQRSRVYLNWENPTNQMQSDYIIERSTDGYSFENITVTPERKYIDLTAPTGRLIYRISSRNRNGSTIYSNNIYLDFQPESEFSLFPNVLQAGEFFQLKAMKGNFELEWINVRGEIVARQKFTAGNNRSGIVPPLAAGMYVVRFRSENHSEIQRVVVQP